VRPNQKPFLKAWSFDKFVPMDELELGLKVHEFKGTRVLKVDILNSLYKMYNMILDKN